MPVTAPGIRAPDLRRKVPFKVYGTAIVESVAETRPTITVCGGTLTGVLKPQVLVLVVEPFQV
jgi:hypothetical protein